jgi:hypothetical protein
VGRDDFKLRDWRNLRRLNQSLMSWFKRLMMQGDLCTREMWLLLRENDQLRGVHAERIRRERSWS